MRIGTLRNIIGSPAFQTAFPMTENPIKQGGLWVQGLTVGLDWADCRSTPGKAFGTNAQASEPPFTDSTAVLSSAAGSFSTNQMAEGTAFSTNQQGGVIEEIELRLNTVITAHSITGYECMWLCRNNGSQYAAVARWNGALNSFDALGFSVGPGIAADTQTVCRATRVGNIITQFVNGVVVNTVDITSIGGTVYTNGNPGIGYNVSSSGNVGLNADFYWQNFLAANL